MPEGTTYYLWTGDPRKAIPADFKLAPVEAVIDEEPHKALHEFTGAGDPDLFDWQVWEGETAPATTP